MLTGSPLSNYLFDNSRLDRNSMQNKTTEPNHALEPTTLAVTVRAPSRTDRAS